ncbi:putative NPP1 domain protein [Microdochium trichocladiopsis]|uniref:NPP1 domain protein n=1 Tax=Microdochium trichocladiopsis TaxID=1682393 RepID=A0A9P8XZX0_9PEZI|nr:putative NPP1 domain protein [Microdochium trichocladiopsis]KAH7026207.1 putative NPP1 domain protein [Microdochium trichocladiopsis]
MRVSTAFALVAAAIGVHSAPVAELATRAVIDHDKVVGFPQTVPAGAVGSAYLRYQPYLKVVNGCVPFPAVDAQGNTSGGLSTSGSSNGDCAKNLGQVYARGTAYNGRYAIMYGWYWPKDSPSPGFGHRHDWESAIVWLDDVNKASPTILAISTSAHGGFDTETSGLQLSGTRPKIQYYSTWPVNHQLGTTSTQGGEQPLVAWESMTQAARDALQNTDFGSANVPFKDGNFLSNLAEASF